MLHHHIARCFTTYSTSRQIQIKSTLLAVTYLILVATVWVAYLTRYVLILNMCSQFI